MDVGEAEGFELLLRPSDGVDVVLGAGEARADVVGYLAIVLVGLTVDHDVADDVGDGGARLRGDGHLCGYDGSGNEQVRKSKSKTTHF